MNKPSKYGQVYNVCTNQTTSVNQLAATIARVLDKPLTAVNKTARQGDVKFSQGDNEKAQQELNFHPSTTLEEGLKKMCHTTAGPRLPD